MGNGNLSLVDLVTQYEDRRVNGPEGFEILEIADDRFVVSADCQQSYMGFDGRFYSRMGRGSNRDGYGHWFRTRQEAVDAIHKHYPSQLPTPPEKPTPDRTKMPVADLAREMAALVPDGWVLRSNLKSIARNPRPRQCTDAEIQAWADRYDLNSGESISSLRVMFEDAASVHSTPVDSTCKNV